MSALRLKRPDGFTLLEILIAIFILGLVMATVLGAFTGIISSSRRAEKMAELYQTGRVLMDLISTDIRCMFDQPAEEKGTFLMGSTETVDGKPMSRIDFVTTNSLPTGVKRNPFLSEVGYRVKKVSGEGAYALWRRSQSPPEYPYDEGGRQVPVCRILERFGLKFTYKNEEQEDLLNAIPEAVVIDFTLSLDGERQNFVTMVRPMIGLEGKSAS